MCATKETSIVRYIEATLTKVLPLCVLYDTELIVLSSVADIE